MPRVNFLLHLPVLCAWFKLASYCVNVFLSQKLSKDFRNWKRNMVQRREWKRAERRLDSEWRNVLPLKGVCFTQRCIEHQIKSNCSFPHIRSLEHDIHKDNEIWRALLCSQTCYLERFKRYFHQGHNGQLVSSSDSAWLSPKQFDPNWIWLCEICCNLTEKFNFDPNRFTSLAAYILRLSFSSLV